MRSIYVEGSAVVAWLGLSTEHVDQLFEHMIEHVDDQLQGLVVEEECCLPMEADLKVALEHIELQPNWGRIRIVQQLTIPELA